MWRSSSQLKDGKVDSASDLPTDRGYQANVPGNASAGAKNSLPSVWGHPRSGRSATDGHVNVYEGNEGFDSSSRNSHCAARESFNSETSKIRLPSNDQERSVQESDQGRRRSSWIQVYRQESSGERDGELTMEQLETREKWMKQVQLKADLEQQIAEKRRKMMMEKERERLFDEQEERRIAAERKKLKEQWEKEQAHRLNKVLGDKSKEDLKSLDIAEDMRRGDVGLSKSSSRCREPNRVLTHKSQKTMTRNPGNHNSAVGNTNARANTDTDQFLPSNLMKGATDSIPSSDAQPTVLADGNVASPHASGGDDIILESGEGPVDEASKIRATKLCSDELREIQKMVEAAMKSELRCEKMLRELVHWISKNMPLGTTVGVENKRDMEDKPKHRSAEASWVLGSDIPRELLIDQFSSKQERGGIESCEDILRCSNCEDRTAVPLTQSSPPEKQRYCQPATPISTFIFRTSGCLNPFDSRPATRLSDCMTIQEGDVSKTDDGVAANPMGVRSKDQTIPSRSVMKQLDKRHERRGSIAPIESGAPDTASADVDRLLVSSWTGESKPPPMSLTQALNPRSKEEASRLSLWERLTCRGRRRLTRATV